MATRSAGCAYCCMLLTSLAVGVVGAHTSAAAAAAAAAAVAAAAQGNYTEYRGLNCFHGHGGVNIDSGPARPTLTYAKCLAHCDATPDCHCAVLGVEATPSNGAAAGC